MDEQTLIEMAMQLQAEILSLREAKTYVSDELASTLEFLSDEINTLLQTSSDVPVE